MNSEHTTENKVNIQQLEPLFVNINPDNPVSEIESFCVNCEENGITRILLTKIPFFKEIIIMAFECPSCGYRNSEVQPGQSLADQAIRVEVSVTTAKDFNRRVIKSEYATISCPELDLEIPPNTQRGKLTTIEGFISTTKEDFETALDDGIYSEMGEEFIEKIKSFVIKLSEALTMKKLPFKFILDDPAGNSFIENPFAPHTDPYAKVLYYDRTKEVLEGMGYSHQPENSNESETEPITQAAPEKTELPVKTKNTKKAAENLLNPLYSQNKRQFEVYKSSSQISSHLVDFTQSIETNSSLKEEALKFLTNCFCCYKPGEAYMCICTIPHFKEIIISCFKCQECGYKTTDVKGGGGISDKATKLTLTVKTPEDLNRDLFKSETASVKIPEIDFETDTGSMGGMFTTVEGVLEKISSNISEMPFSQGDSNETNYLDEFCRRIKNLLKLEQPFTLILDDPISNSFIFSPYAPEPDPNLITEEYERTWEQNEDLGVNDMKVENYVEQEADKQENEEKEV